MREITATRPKFETPVMSGVVVFMPDLHQGSVSKSRMGPLGIIQPHPLAYLLLSILKAIKLLSVKQFLPHGALITLNMAIVKRLSRWYHLLSYSPFSYYSLKFYRTKLRPIIPSENPWRAILPAKTIKMIGYGSARQRKLPRWLKASAGKDIQHIEYPDSSSRGYSVMQEISCPYMPWEFCLGSLKRLCGLRMLLSGYYSRFLQSSRTVESIDLFVIYPDAMFSEFSPYHSVSPGRVIKGYVLYSLKQFSIISLVFVR